MKQIIIISVIIISSVIALELLGGEEMKHQAQELIILFIAMISAVIYSIIKKYD